MSPHRGRYVTASQQLLALAVVVVALAPATRVVSLDVVAVQPRESQARVAGPLPARLLRVVSHPLARRDLVAPLW